MPTQVTNYQCPACTGPLHFSAETGKLVCDYCKYIILYIVIIKNLYILHYFSK